MNKLKLLFVFAVVAVAQTLEGYAASLDSHGLERDVPAYTIVGRDSTCEIFLYSPAPMEGFHLAYFTDDDRWVDAGMLCASQGENPDKKKLMLNPFVTKANDGTWRALWSVGDRSSCFVAAYSEDLVTWRPQDVPSVRERGVSDVVAYQMDDGNFDLYLKTLQGKRYVQASPDFRTFVEDSLEASADDILWQRDTATVGGKLYQGCDFEIPAVHLRYILSWLQAIAEENRADSQPLPKGEADLKGLSGLPEGDVSVVVRLDPKGARRISTKMGLIGDGIIDDKKLRFSAELLKNGDFEWTGDGVNDKKQTVMAWIGVERNKPTVANVKDMPAYISTEQGVSKNNPHHVVLGVTPIYNIGWNGFPDLARMSQKEGEQSQDGCPYEVSFYARNMDGDKKQLSVGFMTEEGKMLSEEKVKVVGSEWQKYSMLVFAKAKEWENAKGKVRFAMIPKGSGRVAVDMVSVLPWSVADKHVSVISQTAQIAGFSPRFVSFSDNGLFASQDENRTSRWKESVGPMQDRNPKYTCWGNSDGTGLGFYEYFLWCEQLNAEPLPILPVGYGKTAMQDVLDLVDWATGDPAVSKWAKLRADAGHPAPFHLKAIGLGHGARLSSKFEKSYIEIAKAIRKKYPDIEVIGTTGTAPSPSSDYMEGWKVVKEYKDVFPAVDERVKKQPGWFVNHQDYYDGYDRKQAKVDVLQWEVVDADSTDALLSKALYLCQMERNGDVVERIGFSKNESALWKYVVQQGETYIPVALDLPESVRKYVGVSVIKDELSGKINMRIVNALPRNLKVLVNGFARQELEVPARQVSCVQFSMKDK